MTKSGQEDDMFVAFELFLGEDSRLFKVSNSRLVHLNFFFYFCELKC